MQAAVTLSHLQPQVPGIFSPADPLMISPSTHPLLCHHPALGHDRTRLPALQRVPAALPYARRWGRAPSFGVHDVPQLRHHLRLRCSRLDHRCLARRASPQWPSRRHVPRNRAHRRLPLRLHRRPHRRPEPRLQLRHSSYSECDVRGIAPLFLLYTKLSTGSPPGRARP